MPSVHTIVVILGPTASGKTSLGIRLAKRFGGVVISADSRQVYRGYDLGSGKVTKREMRGVPHFLIDIASPKRQYSAADFANDFHRTLKRVPVETPIFLVGGSPFYIDAALHPERLAGVKPDPVLRRRLAQHTLPQLLARLKRRDPKRYSAIDRHNRRRVERALEISLSPTPPSVTPRHSLRILQIGILVPRKILYAKIDDRVDSRLRQGMLYEIASLHTQGIAWKRLEALGLEARFISMIHQKKMSRGVATERLKGAIHAFARRQLTWWRRDRSIRWITKPQQAEQFVRRFLKK